MTSSSDARYSADVELLLQVNGVCHELSHTAPDFVRLRNPVMLPAGPAELIVRIDGIEDREPVIIPKGLMPPEHQVHYVTCRDTIHSSST